MYEEQRVKRLTITHIILFLTTILTTLFFGAMQQGVNPLEGINILEGIPFSFTLIAILGGHELAHYIASRRHGVAATLPYFIPAPNIIGTFGAVIKMKAPIKDRRALLDIGVSGPLTGFAIAVAAIVVGLSYSKMEISSTPGSEAGFKLGSSILFDFLVRVILGVNPNDYDIFLHPIAFAGWIGLFVTSLNLLPVGQLDGGHITYAISDRWHSIISKLTIPALFILGLFGWMGWGVWAILLIILGVKHPPLIDPYTPLDRKRRNIGWLSLSIFILTFSPTPFSSL